MFYGGDCLWRDARCDVLCCDFQTSPHGRKSWTNTQNTKPHFSAPLPHSFLFENIKCSCTLPCTPLAATTMAPSMLERPSLSFLIDSGISLPPCFFTCGANSRPTQPATAHTPSTAVTQHYSIRGPLPNNHARSVKDAERGQLSHLETGWLWQLPLSLAWQHGGLWWLWGWRGWVCPPGWCVLGV